MEQKDITLDVDRGFILTLGRLKIAIILTKKTIKL
tara:strand:- start:1355 stop:1459 length:105 start_codon:yes stop_codon:yes gene_type:complete